MATVPSFMDTACFCLPPQVKGLFSELNVPAVVLELDTMGGW